MVTNESKTFILRHLRTFLTKYVHFDLIFEHFQLPNIVS